MASVVIHLPENKFDRSGDQQSTLWYPSKTQPKNDKNNALRKRDDPIICEDICNLRSVIRNRLHEWHDHSSTNTHLLSLDGLSGSGKSTLSQEISTTISHMTDVSFYPVRVDAFIATSRNSPLRSMMLESRELFWKLIYDRQSMIDVLSGIVAANGARCSIPVSHHYNRFDGTVGPSIVHIPAGRKIVMVDGIDSTRILQAIEKFAPAPQTRLLVLTPPHRALQRAAQRDAKQGRRSVEAAQRQRQKEFRYLLPQICEQNIHQADVIYAPEGFHI